MSRLVSLNLDFVLTLQAGLLFLLATAAWSLVRQEAQRPWRWLGWYGFLQSVQVLFELIVFDSGNNEWSQVIRAALRVSSYFCLLEFARTAAPRAPGRWVHLPVLIGLTVAVLLGGVDFGGTWSRFVVALLAAGLGCRTLWQWCRAPQVAGGSHWLRSVGLLLIGYQFWVSLPGRLIDADEFTLAVGVPQEVVRCAFALALALALSRYQVIRGAHLLVPLHRTEKRRRRAACGAVVLLIVVAGWFAAGYSGGAKDTSMRAQILARTQLAAAAVLGADVRLLNWDERDLTNPSYIKLKALMIALRRSNPDLRFALLAGLKEGRSYFLVDSEPPDSADYSPPGQSYDEAAPEYLEGMVSRKSFITGPAKDRWGTWISGSVPIVDAKGDCVADMELDIAAVDWDAQIRVERLPMLLITLLFSTLVVGAFRALEGLRESSIKISLSEQRNRSLVEGSPDCVQMFDLEGRYVAVNQNGLRALGLAESAVLGRHFADLWPEAARPALVEAVRTTVAGHRTSFEADYLRPDGQTVTWRVATNPIYDDAGRVVSFVGICVDLTVRKQAEVAMLVAKHAAEDATLAKSEFLAVMSHEIRTPLSGVIGMLELLQQSALDPKPRRYTEFARDSADSLLHLLDDVLDAAKFEAGKLSLESIPFRPHDYFDALFESAVMRAASKGLTLRHVVTPQVPAVLVGDPTRLRQVINNLVNNALKFTEKGGVTITLDVAPALAGSVELKIAVSDTGIGIPEETRARLFGKYVQADASTTRRFGGTGLGLSIVKNLAGLMGGEAIVSSTVGVGSTFTFSARLEVKPEAPRLSRPVTAPPFAATVAAAQPALQLRVLVVDDDEANRTVAEALVLSYGHAVALAVNGREAVNYLTQEKFDVVLMDCRMPVMDGFTATQTIRASANGATAADVYIIALTANTSAEDRAKCLAAGMNDFASKPVRAPAMGFALERAINYLRQCGPAAKVPTAVAAPSRTLPPVAPRSPVVTAPPVSPPSNPFTGLSEEELLASLEADEAAVAAPEPEPEMSPETLRKITEIFLRETPKRLKTLHDALQRRDANTFGVEVHALKGNSRYFNARRLGELAAKMESLADKNQLEELAPLLAEAEKAYAVLHEQLVQPGVT